MAQAPGRAHGRDTTLYLLAAVAGGTLSGAVLLLVSSLNPWPVGGPALLVSIVGLLTVVAVLHDLGILRFELPQNRRQVRQSVYDHPAAVGALMFGFEMGTGVRTHMTASAPHILVAFALIAGVGAVPALGAGAAFGLARGLVAASRLLSAERAAWDRRLLDTSRLLPLLGSASVGAVLLAVAVR